MVCPPVSALRSADGPGSRFDPPLRGRDVPGHGLAALLEHAATNQSSLETGQSVDERPVGTDGVKRLRAGRERVRNDALELERREAGEATARWRSGGASVAVNDSMGR